LKTIFISIPCLRDTEIYKTIDDIFSKAKDPSRVYVGLFYQYASEEEKRYVANQFLPNKNIRLALEDVQNSIGINKGRNGAKSLYRGEDYFLQIDSHTKFEKRWDSNLIDCFNDAIEYVGSDKVILTSYLNEYYYTKGIKVKRSLRKKTTKPTYNYMVNEDLVLDFLPRWKNLTPDTNEPFLPARKFAANFTFTYGKYEKDLSLNEKTIFWSEEYLKSIDLLSLGYALVYPNREVGMTHLYADHQNSYSGFRLALEDYVVDKEEMTRMFDEEASFVMSEINSHPFKKQYEEYAGIRFGKRMCKTKFYQPSSFFLKDVV
jgi:hypothetical protein